MTKIVIDIEDCSGCPFHDTTPYPTPDSWERAHYWWCKHKDVELGEEDTNGKKVAGYVEWRDKTPIPNWCPIKID